MSIDPQMNAGAAAALRVLRGVPFTKMTGSGNDFVVFNARDVSRGLVSSPEVIRAICDRHNGIGADGVVILESSSGDGSERADEGRDHQGPTPIGLRYFNSDGSLGELCGNATLCSTKLVVMLGMAAPERVSLETDAGLVLARLLNTGTPQIDLAPVTRVVARLDGLPMPVVESHRVGFAQVGVPHVVIITDRLDEIDVVAEGRPIRRHASLAPAGANVNWLMPWDGGVWRYRTYERGVEGETLACGTGAVACAILLARWGFARGPVPLLTQSRKPVTVSFRSPPTEAAVPDAWYPSLSGEGRVVFRGILEPPG